ncbi:hypothetical protein [uncultured Cyclobacterium sp.]|uniref:hypothetical protein n=1 Tax=uncultured Cyclobacterium sp. TaxID=453820 RepID=UPI0030EF179C
MSYKNYIIITKVETLSMLPLTLWKNKRLHLENAADIWQSKLKRPPFQIHYLLYGFLQQGINA